PDGFAVRPHPVELLRRIDEEPLQRERRALPRTVQPAHVHALGQAVDRDLALVELHPPPPRHRRKCPGTFRSGWIWGGMGWGSGVLVSIGESAAGFTPCGPVCPPLTAAVLG